MVVSPGVFLFLQNFGFLGFQGGKNAKNCPKWQKILSFTLHISGTIRHMIVIYGTHVWNDNVFSYFFRFFKILILWVFRGVKVQKVVQNDKKFCPSCSIFQEPYIIWLSFMVRMCKMMISSGFFFIFSKFWFVGFLGGKTAKYGWKWNKILSVAFHISGTIQHMTVIYVTHL